MGLYDRRQYSADTTFLSRNDVALVSFVKTTYKILAGTLVLATIGCFVGLMNVATVIQYKWVLFIAEIGLIFALTYFRNQGGANIALLSLFAFISGMTTVPLIAFVVATQGLSVVLQALAMTTVIFGIMSIYAVRTKSDLGNMGKILFWSVIVIMVFGLLNMFFFHNTWLQFGIASAGVVIFSLYIAYDTQNIIRGNYDSPVMAAVALYLDILNLFMSLLQVLGIMGSNRD